MKIKEIKIKWWFGFGAVTIYPFIFHVNEKLDTMTRRHELVHIDQQKKFFFWGMPVGLALFGVTLWLWIPKVWYWIALYCLSLPLAVWFGVGFWLFLYLLMLPIGFNPFRWAWEWDAYTKGSGYTDDLTRAVLKNAYKLFWHK